MENLAQWQETADALQVPLEDLLTVMSYETAGSMDPMQRGPTTQWGQHRGLIQFGEPQARQYGVDFSSPEAAMSSQLGRDGAVVKYMLGSGFRPGEHSGIDIYSTINAGAPGRYGASDANNGGAPGDVRDKWENQMGGHRSKARGLMEAGGVPLSFGRDVVGNEYRPVSFTGLEPAEPERAGLVDEFRTKTLRRMGLSDQRAEALGAGLTGLSQFVNAGGFS